MPWLYVDINSQAVRQLQSRFPGDLQDLVAGKALYETDSAQRNDIGYVNGPIGDAVLRCIGTVSALEQHQDAGGTVILGYSDGSFRPITVNLRADGQQLPPASSLSPGQLRGLRLAGRRR